MEIENQQETNKDTLTIYNILDTSYFIKLKPLDLLNQNKYITTQYIINEIRDHTAREFYKLNKDFIEICNPSNESIRHVSVFSKKSNDLSCLSIADLSLIALAYEKIVLTRKGSLLRKEPKEYQIIEKLKPKPKQIPKDGKEKSIESVQNQPEVVEEDDEEGWITPENIDSTINIQMKITTSQPNKESVAITNVFLHTGDFTVQNVCLKMGIPAIGVNSLQIRSIKNYIFKCTTCGTFVFDTTKKFCDYCGYPDLMKVGYSINDNGEIQIQDKKADIRKRGCQFDLPKPSLNKKGVVYVLAEDQLPKQRTHNMNIEKILENYSQMKEIPKLDSDFQQNNTSKKYIWGYPKNNPNKAKKKY